MHLVVNVTYVIIVNSYRLFPM